MKKILTIISLWVISNELYAQKVLLEENFDGFMSYSIYGWANRFTGAVPWQAGEPYLVGECIGPLMAPTGIISTNKVAAIVDCSAFGDYDNSNDLLFTPRLSLATDTGAWLKYDSYFGKVTLSSHTEVATVEVSTDTGHSWTVVQNVPANSSVAQYSTYYVSLAAFNHAPAIWVGFRYNDGGGHLHGWAIDNVKIFVPAQKDIALISASPTDTLEGYVKLNTGYKHKAQVMNMGNDPITNFLFCYRQGAGPVKTDMITGINIPRFGTYDLSHHIPDTISTLGKYNVNVWAALAGDTIHNNDSAHVVLHGASFMPGKKLLVEEGTSTQNGYCPKGWVLMNNTPGSIDACKVSVHFGDSDAMHLTYYDDYLYSLHWPNNDYIYVDRKRIIPDQLNDVLTAKQDYFGFADLILDPQIIDDSLTMNIGLKPAIDMTGHFSLAMAITEDHVTGTDSEYAQRNFYAGGLKGPMGGFESKPNPVPASDMYYNFVARTIQPSPGGDTNLVPHTLTNNVMYNYTLGARISPAWQQNKLKAIVMLIRNDDTTVLNSNQTQWYLGVPQLQPTTVIAGLYPNPASSYTNMFFDLSRQQKLQVLMMDVMGRVLWTQETSFAAGENKIAIPVNNLVPGIYLLSLKGEDVQQTLKLEVLH